jgi:hypothetical protein
VNGTGERLRFFLCTRDTAGVMSGLALGLRKLGHAVTTMAFEREVYTPDLGYDVVRGRPIQARYDYNKRASRLVRALAWRTDHLLGYLQNGLATPEYLQHDVFVIFAAPWEPEWLLYPLLKRLGKAVVVYYVGSEARHLDPFSQEFGVDPSGWGADLFKDPINVKLRAIRASELFADTIYSLPDVAGMQIRPYHHAHLPLDVIHEIPGGVPDRRAPVILHAPSRSDIKGTSLVAAAIEQLKREGIALDFRVLTNVPRQAVLDELKNADIVVDQLFFHGPGVLAAEAMSAGCAVATRIVEPPSPAFDPPLCPIRPTNIVERLRELILDRAKRVLLARKAQSWARTTFDPERVAANVVLRLHGTVAPDYVPSFYLDGYAPSERNAISWSNRRLSLEVVARYRCERLFSLGDAVRRRVIAGPIAMQRHAAL